MLRFRLDRWLWACALWTSGTLLIQSGYGQRSYTQADVAEGGRLFRANCESCHGPEGDQVPGIDMGHGKFRQAYTDDALVKIIQNGIRGTGMPPNAFQDFPAGTIVAYMRSMSKVARAGAGNGDAARGKALFEEKGGCQSCHRVGTNGSRVGPDLSDIGALRRATEIEQSILDPNAEVLPQNRFFRVVTKGGETITGRLLNQDTFTVQLFDSKERLVSLQKSSLRESGFVENSPMPSFRDKLNAQELADLTAYLASLKGVR